VRVGRGVRGRVGRTDRVGLVVRVGRGVFGKGVGRSVRGGIVGRSVRGGIVGRSVLGGRVGRSVRSTSDGTSAWTAMSINANNQIGEGMVIKNNRQITVCDERL